MDDGFFVGYLDEYPEYPTQGENLKDFEENLLDIYEMIQDGTLEVSQKHGVLEIAKWIVPILYIFLRNMDLNFTGTAQDMIFTYKKLQVKKLPSQDIQK